MVAPARLLGIDWGSSRRRAYVFDGAGQCSCRHDDGEGAFAARGRFEASLHALRAVLGVDADVPVVMSGMVGSAQGWQEAAYLDSTVPLAQLPAELVPVQGAQRCFIVPGYRYCQGGRIDVMRGEETQLFGASALGHGDGWIVLPGTHSKWVELAGGTIVRFTSYMTGELFAALAAGGSLSSLMAEVNVGGGGNGAAAVAGAGSAPPDALAAAGGAGNGPPDALAAGAARAQAMEPLTATLFEARARVVAGGEPAAQTRQYVSGLLIGTEFAAQLARMAAEQPAGATDPPPVVSLLGAAPLCDQYARIAQQFGLSTRMIDPVEAYCAAIGRFAEKASQ